MHPRMAIDRAFLPVALSEATPLYNERQEFKSLHRYFHQSRPGITEANDPPVAGYREIVIKDIFRIYRTEELAGFSDVDMGNAKDLRRLLWHGSWISNIAGILGRGLRIATAGVPSHGHQSHPGRAEANDPPEAGDTDIVIEDIFRISRTKELAGFGDVDLRNAKDSRRIRGDPFGTEARVRTSQESSAKVCESHLRLSQITGRDEVTEYISPTSHGRPGAIAIPTRVTEWLFYCSMKRRSEDQFTRSKGRFVMHPKSYCRSAFLPLATSVGPDGNGSTQEMSIRTCPGPDATTTIGGRRYDWSDTGTTRSYRGTWERVPRSYILAATLLFMWTQEFPPQKCARAWPLAVNCGLWE
jgi:hypothetical protein